MSDSKARLASAHRDLISAWHRVSDAWRDEASRAFFERSVEPTERALRNAMNALEAMEDTLRQVRKDCTEDR